MALNSPKLTIATFEAGMTDLADAFNRTLTEGMLKTYYRRINFCTDKEFLQTVNDILDKSDWFPTIKVLLDYLPEPERWEPTIEELCS